MSSWLPCTVADCTKLSKYGDYCAMHRRRIERHGTTDAPPPKPTGCMYVGCDRKHKAHNLCNAHYRWVLNPLPPRCEQPGCSRLPRANNSHCSRHKPPDITDTPPAEDLHIIIDEYQHFRGFGWDDERIAARLGTSAEALTRRLHRNGMQVAS